MLHFFLNTVLDLLLPRRSFGCRRGGVALCVTCADAREPAEPLDTPDTYALFAAGKVTAWPDYTPFGKFILRVQVGGTHWFNLPNAMVNGSLIGYNAYAMSIGCPFESPVQSLRMLDPARWCSADIPLWVADRSDDIATRGK